MSKDEIEMVMAMADYNLNVTEVARQLYLHRNTVVYRLQNIHKKYGLNPCVFYDLCELVDMARKEL